MKNLFLILILFVSVNCFSQPNWDSIAKLSVRQTDLLYRPQLELELSRKAFAADLEQHIDHFNDLMMGRFELIKMKEYKCLRFKSYRKYRKCMCQ